MQLNDTHLVLLSAATQRDDHLLVRPDTLAQKASDKLAARFIAAGLVEERVVGNHQPHWRLDQDDAPIGLHITRAGFDALGIALEEAAAAEPYVTDRIAMGHDHADTQLAASASIPQGAVDVAVDAGVAVAGGIGRPGSKRALLIALLQRDEGASISSVMAATGWLPHSTRAALTGLRKSGLVLTRSKDAASTTTYRLRAPEAATDAPVGNTAE